MSRCAAHKRNDAENKSCHQCCQPKKDRPDAVWRAKLTENRRPRLSFVPPDPIRRLRWLREDLSHERTRYWRLEKLLKGALIKVPSVAFKLDSLLTRDMIEALIAAGRDTHRSAGLARRRIRDKHSEVMAAQGGRVDDHHAKSA